VDKEEREKRKKKRKGRETSGEKQKKSSSAQKGNRFPHLLKKGTTLFCHRLDGF